MGVKLLLWVVALFQILANSADCLAQSPYNLTRPKESIILGSGIAAGIVGRLLISKLEPLTLAEIYGLSPEKINRFDRSATANYSESADAGSDIGRLICGALPLTLFFSPKVRQDFRTFGALYIETLLFANVLPPISKGSFKRIRPFVYNPNAPISKKGSTQARRSFFSGHTTNAFATAVFFATTFGDYFPASKLKPLIWSASLLLASAVGYLRIEAGEHFRSDVLAAAAVGSTLGYVIPRLHHHTQNAKLQVFPLLREQQLRLGLHYSLGR